MGSEMLGSEFSVIAIIGVTAVPLRVLASARAQASFGAAPIFDGLP